MIREAVARDALSIGEIWNPVIRSSAATFTSNERTTAEIADMIETRHAQGYGFWVAVDQENVAGFMTYAQFRKGVGYARTMEHSIVLADWAKGRGIGRALMKVAEDHARAGGAHSLIAAVSSVNTDGIRFHEAVGFETIATLPEVGRKFDQWLDLQLMQKFL